MLLWLMSSGGHDSVDTTNVLGFCAVVTSTIRLIPYAIAEVLVAAGTEARVS
jgi:hypothetical protein